MENYYAKIAHPEVSNKPLLLSRGIRKDFLMFVFVLVFNLYFTSAFGVITLYSENYPLRVRPGEVKETFFVLSNIYQGDSDVVIKSELVKGSEIAKLIDGSKSYDVPFGSEVEVPVRIEVPKDVSIGTKYRISAIFRPTPKQIAEGNIQFLVNIGKSIPVEIISEKKDDNKGAFSLTIENEPEELIEKSAPSAGKGRNLWFFVITSLLIAIFIMMFIIILLLRRRQSTMNYYGQAYNNPMNNQQNYGNYGQR